MPIGGKSIQSRGFAKKNKKKRQEGAQFKSTLHSLDRQKILATLLGNLFEWKQKLTSCLSLYGRELRTTGACINVSMLFYFVKSNTRARIARKSHIAVGHYMVSFYAVKKHLVLCLFVR